MRVLMKAQLPTEAGNRAIKDGTLADLIRKTLELTKAEAAYFTTMGGMRTMIAIFDLKENADMVRIGEPLFMGVNASIEIMPCMNSEDLKSGLASLK